uniref:Uncharacterized protein n=1 Tax=Populus alba TaxID=43335 RepID=A0A4U5QJT5_POPAL|nr:hypothetical protein D5086_0000077990 [Populus alba]
MHGEARGGETGGWFWSPLERRRKSIRPKKEKRSSRLELLEWLRRELLPWLPLEWKGAFGQGGGRRFCCCRCYRGHSGIEEDFLQGEREKWCNHHVRWFDGC